MNKEERSYESAEDGVENLTTREMEEWMSVWQEDMGMSSDLQNLREAFSSQQWRRRIKDIIGLVMMLLGIIASISILAGPTLISEFILAMFILLISAGFLWKGYHRMRQERSALPLSPEDYLKASKHNLALMERDNRLHKWVSPIVLPGILATTLWVFYEAWASYTGVTVIAIVTVMVVLLSRGAWNIYVKKPRKLKAERDALEALEIEIRD